MLNTRAEVVEPAEGGGFLARTDRGTISARHVVVATGPFSRPAVPAAAEGLDAEVRGSAFPRLVVLAVLLVVAVPGVVLLRRWRERSSAAATSPGASGRRPARRRQERPAACQQRSEAKRLRTGSGCTPMSD